GRLFGFVPFVADLLSFVFFFTDPPRTAIYTLSLHDALPICTGKVVAGQIPDPFRAIPDDDLLLGAAPPALPGFHVEAPAELLSRSEEHTSELQSRRDLVCRLLLEKKNKHAPQLPHSAVDTRV